MTQAFNLGTIGSNATTIGGTTAQAWGSYAFVGVGSVPTVRKSYNITSITRNSTGNYTFTFTNALADANYAVSITGNQNATANSGSLGATIARTTTTFTVAMGYGAFTAYDFGLDFTIFD
jgi:hypothetical protein